MNHISYYIITMVFLLFGTTHIKAQNPDKQNYLVISKNIKQLNPILLTAQELQNEDGKTFGDFIVIFCGKTVSKMVNDPDLNKLLEQAKEQHIQILACGLSLKKFHINPEELPNSIKIAENGILKSFQLIKKGYLTLTI
ncbi:sulfur reduction protein DsrE [Mangrovimonas sp. CR14]|uniref:DsrE family protein n=1 Tax=Mangrovimonas sp. CR14 TaxID=2706120 RepID=UPI001423B297|nr:DsrE family protein [Mangrovimonas sp. CR14]NIK93580.1 sulfur reduction protein DsrE [Mangrovimonas sp. CR14]